jgi:predicted NodU family carbamoyl transferase
MLYTYSARTDALAAVTHVNKTARIQTVSSATNRSLYNLLIQFKARTGYGVLCNTSLNFNGKGFINKIDDLSSYAVKHNLDGFVIEGRSYILKSSRSYQAYLRMPKSIAGVRGPRPVSSEQDEQRSIMP